LVKKEIHHCFFFFHKKKYVFILFCFVIHVSATTISIKGLWPPIDTYEKILMVAKVAFPYNETAAELVADFFANSGIYKKHEFVILFKKKTQFFFSVLFQNFKAFNDHFWIVNLFLLTFLFA
jgi:hypothetical protein